MASDHKVGGSSPPGRAKDKHGGCSSMAERQVVDLMVAGSNPVSHPISVLAVC